MVHKPFASVKGKYYKNSFKSQVNKGKYKIFWNISSLIVINIEKQFCLIITIHHMVKVCLVQTVFRGEIKAEIQ